MNNHRQKILNWCKVKAMADKNEKQSKRKLKFQRIRNLFK